MMWRPLLLFVVVALAVAQAFACSGSGGDADAVPTPTGTANDNAITAEDVRGHWRSAEWGDLYLETGADGITRGVYPHDQGTVQGRLENGVFAGWWCEAPSRQPPGDAGLVEFRFIRNADGSLSLDGRWKYGTDEPEWRENWDLELVGGDLDEATLARLGNEDEFCNPP